MKVLVTGRGGSGAWKIRGEQLGSALGATVRARAGLADFSACDVALVVKRVPGAMIAALTASGVPWAYDIVDAYPQPESSAWTREESISWVRAHIRRLNPTAVIWPNQRMARDCADDRPGLVLPHHARPGLLPNPIRERVQNVGYEGRAAYLAEWGPLLQAECSRRGWKFVTNPGELADLDIVVAFRGGEWSGYATRHWKSAVKLTNAQACGTPWVGQCDDGYAETASGAEYWATRSEDIRIAFDWLEAQSTREQVADRFVKAAERCTLDRCAASMKEFLERIACKSIA